MNRLQTTIFVPFGFLPMVPLENLLMIQLVPMVPLVETLVPMVQLVETFGINGTIGRTLNAHIGR